MKNKYFFFFGLLILLFVLRLGVILTAIESISHYDELDLGTIARELSRGLHVPYWYYQLDAYSGEALILGPMVIPFSKFFGLNVFAIKMIPLAFSLVTFAAMFAFTLRYFGEKAACYAGLLLVFSPPGLVQLSLCAMAGHSEAFFFGFLALFLGYEYVFKNRNFLFLFLFGLASGFAVWFYYANAMLVFSCLIVFFLSDKKLFFRAMPIFALGFIAAFSHWFIYNARTHFMGMELVAENIKGFGLDRWFHVLKKPFRLFLLNIPLGLSTLKVFFISRSFFAYTYYFCLLAAVYSIFAQAARDIFNKRLRQDPSLILWVYPIVYFFVLTASRFDFDRDIGFVGFRYATPVLFMLLLGAAVNCSANVKRAGIFIFLLALGILGQSSLFFKEPVGRAFAYQGYSYYQLGTRWHFNLRNAFTDYEDFRLKTAAFSAEERRMIMWGISQMSHWNGDPNLFELHVKNDNDLTVESMMKKEPSEYRSISFEWMGGLPRFESTQGMREARAMLKNFPEEDRKYFCQGWLFGPFQVANFMKCPDCYPEKEYCDITKLPRASIYFNDLSLEEWADFKKIIADFKPAEKKVAYRGLGYTLFTFNIFLNPVNKTTPAVRYSEVPNDYGEEIYWGVGWAIREKFREDKIRALDWIAKLPNSDQSSAMEGLEAFDDWYGLK